jgi:hypothetical protein
VVFLGAELPRISKIIQTMTAARCNRINAAIAGPRLKIASNIFGFLPLNKMQKIMAVTMNFNTDLNKHGRK